MLLPGAAACRRSAGCRPPHVAYCAGRAAQRPEPMGSRRQDKRPVLGAQLLAAQGAGCVGCSECRQSGDRSRDHSPPGLRPSPVRRARKVVVMRPRLMLIRLAGAAMLAPLAPAAAWPASAAAGRPACQGTLGHTVTGICTAANTAVKDINVGLAPGGDRDHAGREDHLRPRQRGDRDSDPHRRQHAAQGHHLEGRLGGHRHRPVETGQSGPSRG